LFNSKLNGQKLEFNTPLNLLQSQISIKTYLEVEINNLGVIL